MTKKEYFSTISHVQQVQDIDTFEVFMDIFQDCNYLASLALIQLADIDSTAYAVSQITKYKRYWSILREIDYILSLPHKVISDFILENIDLVEEQCKKEYLQDYATKDEQIEYLEDRILKLDLEIENLNKRLKPKRKKTPRLKKKLSQGSLF